VGVMLTPEKSFAICPLKGVGHREAHEQETSPSWVRHLFGSPETFPLWTLAAHFCIWLCCEYLEHTCVVELMKIFFLICGCFSVFARVFIFGHVFFVFACVFIRLQRGELSRPP